MTALSVPGYDVPIAPTTGSVDTLEATLDSLVALRDQCDAIFGAITNRVEHLRDRFDGVQQRTNVVAERVVELQSRKEAIRVLAPYRFPRPTPLPGMSSDADNGKNKKDKKNGQTLNPVTDAPVALATHRSQHAFKRRKPRPTRAMDPQAASIAEGAGSQANKRPMRPMDPAGGFDFRLLLPAREGVVVREKLYRPGLGSLPRHFDAVSSLCLFNTAENPYREYHDVNIFSLSREERKIAEERRLGHHGLRDGFTTKAHDGGIDFKPTGADELDDIAADLPSDLPLGDIAQLNWAEFENPVIAPSGAANRNRDNGDGPMDLPSVSDTAGIRPSKPLPLPPTVKALAAVPSGSKHAPPPMPSKGGPPPPGQLALQSAPPMPAAGKAGSAPPPPGSGVPPPPPSKGSSGAPMLLPPTGGGGPPVPSKGGPPMPAKGGPPMPSAGGPPLPAKGGPPLTPAAGGPPMPAKGGPPMPAAGGPPAPGAGGPPMPSKGGPPMPSKGPPVPSKAPAGPGGDAPGLPVVSDDRSNLLASIRAFDSSRLKKTPAAGGPAAPGGGGPPAASKGQAPKPTVDASALRAQLENRRAAIMGRTDEEDNEDDKKGAKPAAVRISAGGGRPGGPKSAPAPPRNPLKKASAAADDDDDNW